jgi:hypothetical protein
MRTLRLLVAVTVLICAVGAVRAADEEQADATLTLSGGSVALGLGVTWGGGTLTYKGTDYPISVTGISVGDLGVTKLEAEGRVYHLGKLEDFDGNYAAVGSGVTVVEGRTVLTMKNGKGVRVNMGAKTEGVKISLAAGGVDMKIKK